jgi:pimeloyl-ACP methyl ester carboxylesterase
MLPFQDMVVRRGIERAELAVVSSFTTTSLPSIWFDPAQGEIPVPNGVLIDEDTGLVDLPLDDEDTEKQRELKEALSHYDGFSTSAAIVFEATQAVESETLTSAENLRLFRLETGGTVREVIDVDRGVLGDGRGFFIRPRVPMEPKSHYVAVATRGIRAASGMALEAQPLSALLSSPTPLLIDGTAQVSILTVDEATRLEPWRELARPVVEFLSMESIPPEEIAAIAPFRTLTVAEKLLEQREQLFAKVSARISNVVVRSPSQRGVSLVMPAVETVVTGSFLTRDRLDPRTHRFFENDTVLDTSVPFVLTIPDGVQPGQKIPVVLFGHGLFTSRELVYMIAQTLASAGYAAFAIDFPYHGLRTLCREDLECQGDARCTEFGQCELPDGTLGPLNSIQSPWPDGPSWPAATGAYFIDPDNIVGSRDHFFQAVVDLFQALRVIKENDWAGEWGFSLDTEDVVYMGMSLGAIVGSVFAGVEPQVTTFVLNAGGGDFYRMLSDSAAFESMFDRVLRDQDIVLGTDDAFQFENGLRWLLDSIDPINLAHHATVDPLTYRDPQDGMMKTAPLKRLLLQMAEGDSVVPNSSSRALSERTGVPLRIYSPLISNHAFLFDPTSLEGARARQDAIDFFGAR